MINGGEGHDAQGVQINCHNSHHLPPYLSKLLHVIAKQATKYKILPEIPSIPLTHVPLGLASTVSLCLSLKCTAGVTCCESTTAPSFT